MSDEIIVERQGKTLEIILNRPPANAITKDVSFSIHNALCELRDDPELVCGIISGNGEKFFCAGWDLKAIAAMDSIDDALDDSLNCPGGFAGMTEFWDLKKPVIAAVNGMAVGGGFEIALASDIIVCVDQAEFFLTDIQRGFLPDVGGIQHLPRKLPYNVAMEMLLTCRRMPAEEAKHWGLVNEIVPREMLLDRCRAIADEIALGAPLAIQALKEVVPAIQNCSIMDAFSRTKPGNMDLPIYQSMLYSEDFMEGPRAFAEKRTPKWKGK